MNSDTSEGLAKAIGHFSIDTTSLKDVEPDNSALPLIVTRDFVLFPDVTFPISLGRQAALSTARKAAEHNAIVGIVCQKDPKVEEPSYARGEIYSTGVYADILQVLELPDGSSTAIVRARGKFRINAPVEGTADYPLRADVSPVRESRPRVSDREYMLLVDAIKRTMMKFFENAGGNAPDDMKFNIENTRDASSLINLIATHSPFETPFKIQLLEQNRLKERAFMILAKLSKHEQLLDISRDIQLRTKARIDSQQRSAFLQQQLEAIREELYGDEADEADRLQDLAAKTAIPDAARPQIARELNKLRHLAPQSPDYAVQLNYLETVLTLPWAAHDALTTDIHHAKDVLDADHYGLKRVKERIIEQIAVAIHRGDSAHSPIICLVGAPGVGKTSLGQSIARAMGRKYQRVSLGGLHDEAEIRGHRRTYIGALPGRVIDAVRRAGSSNPLILLDEIDKIGKDFKGDPASALLEVLDPEQNCRFHDNFIDIDFDLSQAAFIATANTLSSIPAPLLDRMEIIELPGYLVEEKVEIARRHLVPRLLELHKLDASDIVITDDALLHIIHHYTSESGVRQLNRQLGKVIRQSILRRLETGSDQPTGIDVADLVAILGPERYHADRFSAPGIPGIATGLAWTAAGGEVLMIESVLTPSRNFAIELTGNLGSVMKESATIAARYVSAHAAELGIDPDKIAHHTVNIHAPEGAIPKDGPSAGITIVTSLVSTYTGRCPAPSLAMTGEISLSGRILAVGGLKEKILAARRAGITHIILPAPCKGEVEDEIPAEYLKDITLHYVSTISEALAVAFPAEDKRADS